MYGVVGDVRASTATDKTPSGCASCSSSTLSTSTSASLPSAASSAFNATACSEPVTVSTNRRPYVADTHMDATGSVADAGSVDCRRGCSATSRVTDKSDKLSHRTTPSSQPAMRWVRETANAMMMTPPAAWVRCTAMPVAGSNFTSSPAALAANTCPSAVHTWDVQCCAAASASSGREDSPVVPTAGTLAVDGDGPNPSPSTPEPGGGASPDRRCSS